MEIMSRGNRSRSASIAAPFLAMICAAQLLNAGTTEFRTGTEHPRASSSRHTQHSSFDALLRSRLSLLIAST